MRNCFFIVSFALVATAVSAQSEKDIRSEGDLSSQQNLTDQSSEKGIVMSGGSTMYEGFKAEEKGIVMSGGSTMYEGIKAEK